MSYKDLPEFRVRLENIKQRIRAGEMVNANRQSGKTTAIMEVIHEDYSAQSLQATVLVPWSDLGTMFIKQYMTRWPDDVKPRMLYGTAVHDWERKLRGYDWKGKLFADALSALAYKPQYSWEEYEKVERFVFEYNVRGCW